MAALVACWVLTHCPVSVLMANFVSVKTTFAKSAQSCLSCTEGCGGLAAVSGPLHLPSWPFRSVMGVLLGVLTGIAETGLTVGMAEMVLLVEMAGTLTLVGMAEVVGVRIR